MYQRVASNEKMMMGMCMSYNLLKPEEVANMVAAQDDTDDAKQKSIKNLPDVVASPENPRSEDNQQRELVPVDYNFDVGDFLNGLSKNDLVVAATQVEAEFEKENGDMVTVKKTAVIKKSPRKNYPQCPVFANCKIANININIQQK